MAVNIIAIRKRDGQEKILQTVSTTAKAESFCEVWGWNYDDGQESYWLEYEEINEKV